MGMNMKKIICVLKEEIAEQISEAIGCNYIEQDIGNNQTVYSFIETDRLFKYLKSNFSKRDWFYDNKMRF